MPSSEDEKSPKRRTNNKTLSHNTNITNTTKKSNNAKRTIKSNNTKQTKKPKQEVQPHTPPVSASHSSTSFDSGQKIMLNPTELRNWTKKQVASLLCSPLEVGGAGLMLEEVRQLYCIDFAGIHLDYIADGIKEKDENNAFEKLMDIYKYSKTCLESNQLITLRSIVSWVKKMKKEPIEIYLNNSFKDVTDLITEHLKKERTDPKYNYLRNLLDLSNMKKLELMIGSNIPLPQLGEKDSDHLPKDYDPEKPYLLTRQRFVLLKKVVEREEGGFVLSGPYGISKSYSMYLLAAYAFVNSIPLLYVPKCGKWVSEFQEGGKTKADNYLRSLLFYLNSDILSDNMSELQTGSVVSYMSNNLPVFFLFDDHNELFKKDANGKMATGDSYLYHFTRWTTVTVGKNTMTVYCGSGHSSFEDYLQGGAVNRIIRIIPPTKKEFNMLISDFGLQCDARIDYVTGRVPRELAIFSKFFQPNIVMSDDNISIFMSNRMNEYERRLAQLSKELSKENTQESFLGTLEMLFTLGLHKGRPISVQGTVYDKGLMYKDSMGKIFIINEPAKRTLFNYYCSKIGSILTIPNNITSSEKGAMFQRFLLVKEFSRKHSFKYFALFGNPITLEYEVNVHQSLDLKKQLCSLSRKNYLQNTTVLYIPEQENFPAFDYAIISYNINTIRIYLKQATISTIDDHYQGKNTDIDELFQRVYIVFNDGTSKRPKTNYEEDSKFSLLELIIHGVIGDFGIISNNIKKRKYDLNVLMLNDNVFQSTFKIDNLEINWYYIYESGSPSNEQSSKKVKEQAILYRNREEIINTMQIHFQ